MRSLPKFGSFGFILITILLCSLNASAQLTDVNPDSLFFTYQIGGPNPPAQNPFVTGGSGTQFSVDASGTPWLAVQPLSGVVPSNLIVSVVPPANAVPGTLTDGSAQILPLAVVISSQP